MDTLILWFFLGAEVVSVVTGLVLGGFFMAVGAFLVVAFFHVCVILRRMRLAGEG